MNTDDKRKAKRLPIKVRLAMEAADSIFDFVMNEDVAQDLADNKSGDQSFARAHDELVDYVQKHGGPDFNGNDQEWSW